MKSTRILLAAAAALALSTAVRAGSSEVVVASDAEIAALSRSQAVVRTPARSTRAQASRAQKRAPENLNVYQALAKAITRTVVLQMTQEHRRTEADANAAKTDITMRLRGLRVNYRQDLYGERCFFAVGPALKWQTTNGHWNRRRVNLRALAQAVAYLRANHFHVHSVSLSVRSEHERQLARRILGGLRLTHHALIGVEPDAPVRATVKIDKQR